MHKTWDAYTSILAELDCLCALSLVSFTLADGIMCRPILHDIFYDKNGAKIAPFINL